MNNEPSRKPAIRLGPAGVALRNLSTRTKEGRLRSEQARATVEAAANLGLALRAKGVNQIELARRLGVDRSGITRLLQGGNVSVERLAAAAHVIGLSVHVTYGPAVDEAKLVEVPRSLRRPKAARRTKRLPKRH
jgi:hypothetical protein